MTVGVMLTDGAARAGASGGGMVLNLGGSSMSFVHRPEAQGTYGPIRSIHKKHRALSRQNRHPAHRGPAEVGQGRARTAARQVGRRLEHVTAPYRMGKASRLGIASRAKCGWRRASRANLDGAACGPRGASTSRDAPHARTRCSDLPIKGRGAGRGGMARVAASVRLLRRGRLRRRARGGVRRRLLHRRRLRDLLRRGALLAHANPLIVLGLGAQCVAHHLLEPQEGVVCRIERRRPLLVRRRARLVGGNARAEGRDSDRRRLPERAVQEPPW